MAIGDKIRELRKRKGITPEELGMLCNLSGAYIRKLEAGQNISITLKTASKLAHGLGITAASLLEDDMPTDDKPIKIMLKEIEAKYEELSVIQVVVYGTVPASIPCSFEQATGEYIELPREELGGRKVENVFALRISGDSLSGDDIHDGDIVVVDKSATEIIDGKIYIINLNTNDCVVKHVTKSRDHLILTSSNSDYEEILATEVQIMGQVILSGRWKKQ